MHVVGAWRADAAAHRLAHQEFADAVVTFDPLSGSTLMLSPLCWFVLTELMQADGPRGTDALLRSVCEAAEEPEPTRATALLDEALASLVAAGLIRAETP